jgi:phage shock protein B
MFGAIIVGICVGGVLLILATIGLIVGIFRAVRTGGFSQEERQARNDEARMIQDMFNSLSKMEERVEALETILIERQKKDSSK